MLGILGQKCPGCGKRFWAAGGTIRLVTAEGDHVDISICEECSQDLDRVAAVGAAMDAEIQSDRQ